MPFAGRGNQARKQLFYSLQRDDCSESFFPVATVLPASRGQGCSTTGPVPFCRLGDTWIQETSPRGLCLAQGGESVAWVGFGREVHSVHATGQEPPPLPRAILVGTLGQQHRPSPA